MNENKNWSDLGDDFANIVNDAITKGDFSGIGDLVTNTVDCAIKEAKKQTQNVVKEFTATNYTTGSYNKTQQYINQQKQKQVVIQQNQRKNLPRVSIKKVGKVSGILYTVFGGIGLGLSSLVLMSLLLLFFLGEISVVGVLFAAAFAGLFGWMIGHGCKLQGRVLRAERFAKLSGQNMYVTIENLASHMGKSKKAVINDVKNMLKLGIFPEGHLDAQQTCLILSNDVYKTYLQTEKARQVRENEETFSQKEQDTSKVDHASELTQMIQEGNECIRKLRDLNDAIEGEVISNKLFRLENLLKEIFSQVKEHPEKMQEMHKFMDYYLPTTLKLVEAYAEFDDVSEPGDDIIQAKQQIENTLDTINSAFNELLNNLFRDRVFDVTTDAQVLQTLLSKEGLTKSDFEKVPVK